MWTSANSRDVRQFGYTYPDLTNNDRSTLVRRINQLYGSSAVGATLTKRAEFGGEGSEDTAPHESRQDTRREYAVNVKADKLSSVGSYTVYVFLGQPGGDNYNEWSNHPDFVGVHAVISSRETKHDKNVFVTGTVPLTQKLQDRIRGKALHSDDQADVIPYFKKKLNWFCVKVCFNLLLCCRTPPGEVVTNCGM